MIDLSTLKFSASNGLIPCIVQDVFTEKVLMLGYMNEPALQKTLSEKKVTFFSRSKNRLWAKGESSGHFLLLKYIRVDCDNDTLLIQVIPQGSTCHAGTDTCFNEVNKNTTLDFLETIIQQCKNNPDQNSYTSRLLQSGINKVAQKVGEEAVELVIEAKDDNKDLFLGEAADLIYHYLVLLAAKNYSLSDVVELLRKRNVTT